MQENEKIKDEVMNEDCETETTVEGTVKSTDSETIDIEDSQNEEASETEEGCEAPEKKKSFFKKDKKDKKDEKIEELNDRLMRTLAEFDNFRKRSEREKAQMFEVGAKDIIEKILPVVDNFERGLQTVTEEEKQTGFAQGIDMVYKQLITVLESAGVKAIEAVGKEFDPNFHNAVMHGEDAEVGENIITEEFQKGYLYRESVVRHSMVKVVN